MSRILLLLVLGFSLNKLHILPKETEGIVSKLVTMLFLPCLMLYTNMTECQLASFVSYGRLVLALLLVCKASPDLCTMAVLAYTGPCGMNAVLYPAAYGQDCRLGASMVLISSLCSVLTIPLVYALSQYLIG